MKTYRPGIGCNPSVLSVIIPTLNEAKKLPILLADLKLFPSSLEILVVDAGSTDCTAQIAELGGASLIKMHTPNRGAQLHQGALISTSKWLLFLHADSRLPKEWSKTVLHTISRQANKNIAWFFDFKVSTAGPTMRLMELAVAMRSNLVKRPYGDQGLLISKHLYEQIGGYKNIHLMEDVDIVQRINYSSTLNRLGIPLYTDGRKWEERNVILQAFKNARLRHRWRKGESPKRLLQDYNQ
ncbi:TIGR04283 family arsenosugar biosynthesis glycosyltransferase [Prochlorococcus sp. MIT 1300]|uniref:TIGR04283 family arsenosugar biosynthesis glycosyltransferase n=1 Tax=Prochlorococcus sp. MIT 1300 TaxID=3096218 RepID=UPI002A75F788|nr:TIGR04283 family arsenosugar biosynthesis glycosyltransferase [Prochlorococcus sp. MIT 1300]